MDSTISSSKQAGCFAYSRRLDGGLTFVWVNRWNANGEIRRTESAWRSPADLPVTGLAYNPWLLWR